MALLAFLLFLSNMLLLAVLLLLAFLPFLLLLASLLIPGVPKLAGCFTYWIVERDILHNRLSDYGYRTAIFFCYRTIGILNIVLANSRNYWTTGYRTLKKLSVAHLWYLVNKSLWLLHKRFNHWISRHFPVSELPSPVAESDQNKKVQGPKSWISYCAPPPPQAAHLLPPPIFLPMQSLLGCLGGNFTCCLALCRKLLLMQLVKNLNMCEGLWSQCLMQQMSLRPSLHYQHA